MLEGYLDVARLFRGYTWRDLPTRYLRSYTAPEKIKRADEAARRRAGGVPSGGALAPLTLSATAKRDFSPRQAPFRESDLP